MSEQPEELVVENEVAETDPRADVSSVTEAPDQLPEPDVVRVIIEDPIGRLVSVPEDDIPLGSTIIGPDVLPGQSSTYAETNTSEPVNPEPEPEVTPESEPEVNPETGDVTTPEEETPVVQSRRRS